MITNIDYRRCSVDRAISAIAVEVNERYEAGSPYNAVEVIGLMEMFAQVGTLRWRIITKEVVDRLEYWGIFVNESEELESEV